MIDTPNSDAPAEGSPAGAPEPLSPPAEVSEGASPAPVQPGAEVPPPASLSEPIPGQAKKPATRKPNNVINPYIWGTGRRKTAVARVRVKAGDGKFLINKRALSDFFVLEKDRQAVMTPLRVVEAEKAFDVWVNVKGGGPSGQAGAVVLGLARALRNADGSYEPALREHQLLSRDPRKVERKKYGQRGARRRFQFSKR